MKTKKNLLGKTTKSGCLSFCLLICLVLQAVVPLAGCGNKDPEEIPVESVELHEPEAVAATTATEQAARRNLYDASLLESHVAPYAEEYSFSSAQQFNTYVALPGDTVKKGDLLVSAVDTDLLKKIEAAEETLQDLTEEYEKYRQETEESLKEQRDDLSYLESILDNLNKQKPEEQIPGPNGTPVPNPALADWQAEYDKWQGDYNLQDFYISKAERELRQRQELYDLDHNYYSGQLQKLKTERKNRSVYSQMDGVVVGIRNLTSGIRLSAGDPVIAVGDTGRKILVCNYISPRFLTKAADIYAFINGKRYEVAKLEDDDVSHTVFQIQDDNDEISMGDYAVLVVMHNYRKQVVTVPLNSLHRENGGDYVYVLENGLAVSREVKKGMDDGLYVEITSGLEEGETIVVSEAQRPLTSSVVLERGSTGITYDIVGEAFLPLKFIFTNPIEYGTTFMDRFKVEPNQQVKKGDVIAKVLVEGDQLDISRLETRLRRDRERLADLMAKNREEDQERILQMQESIRDQEEELKKRSDCYNTTEICSPIDGFIESLYVINEGEIIDFQEGMVTIADKSSFYIALSPHYENIPAYGDIVEVEYPDSNYDYIKTQCMAVTLLPDNLSDSLGEFVLLKPDRETAENLEITDESRQYYITIRKNVILIKGTKKAVDNVVLLPVDALYQAGSDHIGYVWVTQEDGSPLLTPVLLNPLSGEMNKEYYWVIDGLTEGMEVLCSE